MTPLTTTDQPVVTTAPAFVLCPLGCGRQVAAKGDEIHYCVTTIRFGRKSTTNREYVGTWDGEALFFGACHDEVERKLRPYREEQNARESCDPLDQLAADVAEIDAENNTPIDPTLCVGTRVVLTSPNEYHGIGIIRAVPGHTDNVSGRTVPYYSVDFQHAEPSGATDDRRPTTDDRRPTTNDQPAAKVNWSSAAAHPARLHRSAQTALRPTDDDVSPVLFELALTDPCALAEFLRAHTDLGRQQLAWRYAPWLKRHGINVEWEYIAAIWAALLNSTAAHQERAS